MSATEPKVGKTPGPPKGTRPAGRKKGTPNKDTQTLRDKANTLGVDPFTVLLMFAKGDWQGLGYAAQSVTKWTGNGIEYEEDTIQPAMRLKAACEAVQYLEPKRKALEHSGPDGGPIETRNVTQLPDDALDARIQKLLEQTKGTPNGSS